MVNNNDFLTEAKLGDFLNTYLSNGNWISQFKLPNSRFRLDYFSKELNIGVEFDGYQHYTSSRQIIADYRKNELCDALNINLIRIPYFVQLSRSIIKFLFDINLNDFKQTYSHGFISKKSTMIYPADFCYLGIERFKNDLEKFSMIKSEIIDSLRLRDIDIRLILPDSLTYLLK